MTIGKFHGMQPFNAAHILYITAPSSPSVGIPGVGVVTGAVVVLGMVGCVVVGKTVVVGGSVGVAVLERIVP